MRVTRRGGELDCGKVRNLDAQGSAAFGHAVDGTDVLRATNAASAAGQSLDPPLLIERIVRSD